MHNINIKHLIDIAIQAGEIIMLDHHLPKKWVKKEDNSPVTESDIKANAYIVLKLREFYPDVPVVAEEHSSQENAQHIDSEMFWLVDPIDGTKAYIKGLDDFTVNIGLIQNKQPIIGIIYLPATGVLYYNTDLTSAFKQIRDAAPVQIYVGKAPNKLIVTTGLSAHRHEFIDFLGKHPIDHIIKISSSVKFCQIAEGVAHIYPHFNPTMEWDTAAGQAILQAAGGVVQLENGQVLTYGKPRFLNPNFIAHNKCWRVV
jgi:3'(2'), 5'-bisphosphate nucleotidase